MHQGNAYMQYAMHPPPQPTAKTYTPAPAVTNEMKKMLELLEDLFHPNKRENSILNLSQNRDFFPLIGPALWYGVGTMAILLQEIVSVYPLLSKPVFLTKPIVNRVTGALTLLQAVASHESTRRPFVEAQICHFLFPFLRLPKEGFDGVVLTSLGVIAALVKTDDEYVMRYLLGTEIFPLCLKIMESGKEISKTLATFTVHKLLQTEGGLQYICEKPDRFTAVVRVLDILVRSKDCAPRLLRHIIRCYQRLSEHSRACEALRQCLPEELRNDTYKQALESNQNMRKSLLQLLVNIGDEGAKKIHQVNSNA